MTGIPGNLVQQLTDGSVVVYPLSVAGAWPGPMAGVFSGYTDDLGINQALGQGRPVRLVAGTYIIGAVIEVPAWGRLLGEAIYGSTAMLAGTIFSVPSGTGLPAVIASQGWYESTNTSAMYPCEIRSIQVNGNTSGATHGIVLQTFRSLIENCQVGNVSGDGLRFDYYGRNGTTALTNTASENRVIGCAFRQVSRGVASTDPGSGTAAFTDGWIRDCVVSNCTGAGAIQVTRSAGWLFEGNHVYQVSQSGILAGVPQMTRIIGNYIDDFALSATASTTAAPYVGIGCGATGYGLIADSGYGSSIIGNNVRLNLAPGNAASVTYGIAAESASGAQGTLTQTGNVVAVGSGITPATAGIYWACQGSTATLVGASTGNFVEGAWTTAFSQVPNTGTLTVTAGV